MDVLNDLAEHTCVGCFTGSTGWDDYLCLGCRDRSRELRSRILNAKLRDIIDTGAGPLTVVHRSWPAGTTVQRVLADALPADSVVLTSDGRSYYAEPHQGTESPIESWVYVERWEQRGRVFHGYVDPISRRIVQWG